jgi:hypothetical protein
VPEISRTKKPFLRFALVSPCGRKVGREHGDKLRHGWWFVGGTPGSLIHSSRQQLKLNRYFDDVEDLAKLIDEVNKLRMDLWEWTR